MWRPRELDQRRSCGTEHGGVLSWRGSCADAAGRWGGTDAANLRGGAQPEGELWWRGACGRSGARTRV